MNKILIPALLVAVLVSAPPPAGAEIIGFELNNIEGVGDLEGNLEDRFEDEQKVSYTDCLTYLSQVVPGSGTSGCSADADCASPTSACLSVNGASVCVECADSSDCAEPLVCDQETHICLGRPEGDCALCTADLAGCALADGKWTCVECTDDSHCSEATPYCSTADNTCSDVPDSGACDQCPAACALYGAAWTCVDCVISADCADGEACDVASHTCVAWPAVGECTSDDSCGDALPYCVVVEGEWTCVGCASQSACSDQGEGWGCDQQLHICTNFCQYCTGATPGCVKLGSEWTCVACADDTDCADESASCDGGTHTCANATTAGECDPDQAGDCHSPSTICALSDSSTWSCHECTDDDHCTLATEPACAMMDGIGTCVECTADRDCDSGVCDLGSYSCTEGETTGENPKIEIRWSVDATSYSGCDYSVKVGSCSETGEMGPRSSESCHDVETQLSFDGGYTNREVKFDLTYLLGEECSKGDTGESAVYFLIACTDPFTGTDQQYAETVNFVWDYDAPSPPSSISLEAGESNIKVDWQDESNTGAVEYNVYWSTASFDDDDLADLDDSKKGASSTSYQINDLEIGATYYVGVTVVDDFGNESTLSEIVSETPVAVDDFWEHYKKAGGQEQGGYCFVATAAHGSAIAPPVLLLRAFRDRFLLTNPWGRRIVDFYYTYGPSAARAIAPHPVLRAAARVLLAPAVALAFVLVEIGAAGKAALLLSLMALLVAFRWRRQRLAKIVGRTS